MSHVLDRVSSSARVLPAVDGNYLSIVRASGPYLYGADGRRYVDTAMGMGGTILGHAHPSVVEATTAAIRNGSLPGFSHPAEASAAAALVARMAPLGRVVFTNSGSEAVHMASRIARVATGRGRIAKMAAGFDGWLDEIAFGNVATAEAAFAGPRPSNERVTLLRFNDFDDVERLFSEHDDIAAIVYEPMLANAACIMPAPGYLEHVQEVARRHGALLIADEVLMGFRISAGLASHAYGLDPDIVTIGKAVGSGIPVAAVIGRTEIMEGFHAAKGLRGGTFSGNPVACAAVEATLPVLDSADYPALQAKGDKLRAHISSAFGAQGIAVSTSGYGNVFSLWFAEEAPKDYITAQLLADPARSMQLHLALRRRDVLAMPSPYGRIYTTFAHDDEAFSILHDAFSAAAVEMA
jgi:glutamate-1-semialdehyde 2,1-aminomutase